MVLAENVVHAGNVELERSCLLAEKWRVLGSSACRKVAQCLLENGAECKTCRFNYQSKFAQTSVVSPSDQRYQQWFLSSCAFAFHVRETGPKPSLSMCLLCYLRAQWFRMHCRTRDSSFHWTHPGEHRQAVLVASWTR